MLKCVPVGLVGKSSPAYSYALPADGDIDYSAGLHAVFRQGKTRCLLDCELCEAQKGEL
jgi:hypothetical protein